MTSQHLIGQRLIGVVLATLCLAGAAAADPLGAKQGAPGGLGRTRVLVAVNSRGLDLSGAPGADLFLRRLEVAVGRACDDRASGMPLQAGPSVGAQACRREALELAMTYVHSPLVKRRYAEARTRGGVHLARR